MTLMSKPTSSTKSAEFVLPDIGQQSCALIDTWSRPLRRLLGNAVPFNRDVTSFRRDASTFNRDATPPPTPSPTRCSSESDSSSHLRDSGASTATTAAWLPEEIEFMSDGDEVETHHEMITDCHEMAPREDMSHELVPREDGKIGCEVEAMSDAELDYVEYAHRHSRLLDIYGEPSLRFIAMPPIPMAFVVPYVRGESGYQSEPSPPLPVERQQYNGNNKNKKTGVAASPLLTSSSSTNSKSIDSAVVEQSTVASSLPASLPSHPPALSSLSRPGPPPSSPLNGAGQFEVSKMDVLSEEIWHYHNSVTQTTSMLNRKLHLRDMLYYSICPVFPMCGLYVVGSSLNGFGNNSSDMDLCLMITNKDLDQKTDAVVVLNMILSALSQLDWVSHQKLILAKVPILRVKFTAPFADITVDLNANNSVAIKNTHLLCYYSSFDWRVRPLVSVVKEWAKRKGINDAKGSSFTSYSLVLMVIHYLQCGADPAVLPCLQQLYPKRFSNKCDVRTLNVTMPLQAPQTDDWHYSEKATLGELLIGFLDYYANKFDYDRDAISVRQGKRVDRAVMARNRPSGQANSGTWRSQWRCICIEEPFTLSNTAHSIYDEMVFGAIKDAFGEAHVELERSRDLKSLLSCKPITAHVVGGGAVCFAYEGSSRSSHHLAQPPSAESPPLFCQLTNESGAELTNGRGGGVAVVPSGSANSLNTAEGGSSSSGSSSNGEEQDHDRLSESRCGLMSSSASSLHQNRSGSLPRSSGGRPRSNRKQRTPLVPARV